MKNNLTKTPGFDEIIFENRNKSYGAYDLRRRYNSVTGLSLLIGIFIGIGLVVSFSFSVRDDGSNRIPVNSTGSFTISNIIPELQRPEPIKMPEALQKTISNAPPVITDDTSEVDYIPTVEEMSGLVQNGNVNDTFGVQLPLLEEVIPAEPEPVLFVKEMPEFPGGVEALLQTISNMIVYPEEAIKNNIQGKVILKFVITSVGTVDRIEVLRGIDSSLDKEATRVIGALPKFKPGRNNGIAVPVWYTIPVNFQLRNN